MWNGRSLSLVMATYREKDSIRVVIEDFIATRLVDEIIVVDNNAESGTREALAPLRFENFRILHEPRQGYGHALQTGLKAATCEYVVTIEPDGTYVGRDLERFLVLAASFPVVFGSRTIEKTINTEWGFWRREVNVLYGLLIHLLFNTNMITDIGCTYKLMRRETVRALEPVWRHGSSLFATELLLLVIAKGIPFIEIPVTFKHRVGPSAVVSSRWQLCRLAMLGLWQILEMWFVWATGRVAPNAAPDTSGSDNTPEFRRS